MLETFRMQTGRKEYRRLVGAFRQGLRRNHLLRDGCAQRLGKMVRRSRFSFVREGPRCSEVLRFSSTARF
jgi:hypothetical protein